MSIEIQRVPWRRGDTPQWDGTSWHQSVKATANQFWVFNGTTGLFAPRALVVADLPSGITSPDYLVGTANANLSAEIVVGTSPGGELGGTWASPTVDATHSGSSHLASREIPIIVSGTTTSTGAYIMPDEVATNFVAINFYVPTTWDGSTNITLTTLWVNDSTGLADLETEIIYRTEVDENTIVNVQAFTNTNLTWTNAVTVKTLTTTITPAAGRHYRVRFRRNTGDASTGTVFFQSARAVTALR